MYFLWFDGGSFGSKMKLVHTPCKTWSDAQGCFKRNSEWKIGIHSKSMDKYNKFLKQVSGKKDPVDQQLRKSTIKQVDKT